MNERPTRRDFLWRLGGGLGGIALAQLLGQEGLLAGPDLGAVRSPAELNGGLHHRAKVRRVIQLFMNGGVSQMDTFDYKPELERRHGQPFDPGSHVEAPTSTPGNLMKSPFPFRQHGECGRWVSSVLPAPGRLRRRPGVPHGAELEDERPRPGQLHDEHRVS